MAEAPSTLPVLAVMTLPACATAMHVTYRVALCRRDAEAAVFAAAGGSGGARGGGVLQPALRGLLLALPFVLLTSLATPATLRVILNFTLCWVTPCKLLLLFHANFFLDSAAPAWLLSRFSHFLLVFLLPIRIKAIAAPPRPTSFGRRLPPLMLRFCVLFLLLRFYDTIPLSLNHLSHCVLLYLTLELPHRLASLVLLVLFGVQTHPTFCRPWLASSLTDFWGRRWDLTANALLRHTVYNPIINYLAMPSEAHIVSSHAVVKDRQCELVSAAKLDLKLLSLPLGGRAISEQGISVSASPAKSRKSLVKEKKGQLAPPLPTTSLLGTPIKPPSLAVRLAGVNATFFVSGLIHELLYFCVTQGEAPTWEVTCFFIVQGMATSVEIMTRRAGRMPSFWKAMRMRRALEVALTMGFMYATTSWLFFPQLVRSGVFLKCSEEHKAIVQNVRLVLLRRKGN